VIRTVEAVTAPLLAAGPNALTQLPTARSPDDADCVALTVVDFDVVIVSFSGLGGAGFLVLLELFESVAGRVANPAKENFVPEIVTVDPCTVVTLPEATESEASCFLKLLEPEPPPGKLGRLPLLGPPPKPPRPGNPPPPGKPPPVR
jgi:hypothetical protein